MATVPTSSKVLLAFFLIFLAASNVRGSDEELYVYANRKGCVSVRSQEPCPATKLSPRFAVTAYSTVLKNTEYILKHAKKFNANAHCLSALKKVHCSSTTPKCFDDGSKDYGDAKSVCLNLNLTCGHVMDIINFDILCKTLPRGKQPLDACVLANTSIEGACPQPKYKMPSLDLFSYKLISSSYEKHPPLIFSTLKTARYRNPTKDAALHGALMFSRQCVAAITGIHCILTYCSADEQRLLVKFNWKKCRRIIDNCFEKPLENIPDGDIFKTNLVNQKHHLKEVWCAYYKNTTETESPTSSGVRNYQTLISYVLLLALAGRIY